jgi:hypothetical protein
MMMMMVHSFIGRLNVFNHYKTLVLTEVAAENCAGSSVCYAVFYVYAQCVIGWEVIVAHLYLNILLFILWLHR